MHDVGKHHDWDPEAAAEAHGEIDHVDDAGRGVEGDGERDDHAHAGEGDGADESEGDETGELGCRDGNVCEGDAEDGEQADDDDAEGRCRAALREKVSEGRHGAGALELEPAGAEFAGESTADAEECSADHAEDGVGGEHVLSYGDIADVLPTVHDEAEEEIEDDREADDGKREGAGAEEADELIAGLGEEDADVAGE